MWDPPKIDCIREFKRLRNKKFVQTIRRGSTGIGLTLESNLGISENNNDTYDFVDTGEFTGVYFELKSQRKKIEDQNGRMRKNNSMISLLTQAPHTWMGGMSNKQLLKKYGYRDTKSRNRMNLNATLRCSRYVNGENVKNIKIQRNKNVLAIIHRRDGELAYYDLKKLGNKLANLCIARADVRILKCDCRNKKLHDKETGRFHEYFHFNEIHIFQKFDYKKFCNAIDTDLVKLDLRMHISTEELRSSDEDPDHDRGTAFRMKFDNISLIYDSHKLIQN